MFILEVLSLHDELFRTTIQFALITVVWHYTSHSALVALTMTDTNKPAAMPRLENILSDVVYWMCHSWLQDTSCPPLGQAFQTESLVNSGLFSFMRTNLGATLNQLSDYQPLSILLTCWLPAYVFLQQADISNWRWYSLWKPVLPVHFDSAFCRSLWRLFCSCVNHSIVV